MQIIEALRGRVYDLLDGEVVNLVDYLSSIFVVGLKEGKFQDL